MNTPGTLLVLLHYPGTQQFFGKAIIRREKIVTRAALPVLLRRRYTPIRVTPSSGQVRINWGSGTWRRKNDSQADSRAGAGVSDRGNFADARFRPWRGRQCQRTGSKSGAVCPRQEVRP